ncbi:MAG TPA: glycosyltransferase family 39 protein [Oligoflexia bacterium]|nr:glycosyltransferase family 39 protein [Oligoflexia bacterium]
MVFDRVSLVVLGTAFALFGIYFLGVDQYNLFRFYALTIFCGCLLVGVSAGALVERGYFLGFTKRDQPISGGDQFALSLILILAVILRLRGIDFGIPDFYHPDEQAKVNLVQRMLANNTYDPNYFLHPSLLLYSTLFVFKFFGSFFVSYSPVEQILLSGRLVSCLAGVLSVFLTFKLARISLSQSVALLSALLLAVSPLHITCSRYLKEDSLLTFFTLFGAFLTVSGLKANQLLELGGIKFDRYLVGIAITAGLASGAKYSGFLTVSFLFFYLLVRGSFSLSQVLKDLTISLVVFFTTFFLTSPYIILNRGRFLKDFSYESRHMLSGHVGQIDAWSQLWMFHLSESLPFGIGFLPLVCAVLAIGFVIWRFVKEFELSKLFAGEKPQFDLIALMFLSLIAVIFYLPAEWVKAKPPPQPERYVLPVLPPLLILASCACRLFLVDNRRWLNFIVVVIFVAEPFANSFALARDIKPDTRLLMKEWLATNLREGDRVLLDWKDYSPNLGKTKINYRYLERARILSELDLSRLKNSGYQYLVLSSFFYMRYFNGLKESAVARQVIRNIQQKLEKVVEFTAPSGSYGFHNPKLTLYKLSSS